MAEKDKPTKKKSYKKPTADNLGDGDLKDVTGGGESGGENVIIFFCRLAGAAATEVCKSGGAAGRQCESGGAAGQECIAGSEARKK
jgi:hypothetical protein